MGKVSLLTPSSATPTPWSSVCVPGHTPLMASCSGACAPAFTQARTHSASCSTQLGWLPRSTSPTLLLRCSQALCLCSQNVENIQPRLVPHLRAGFGQRPRHLGVAVLKDPEVACSLSTQAGCACWEALSGLEHLLSAEVASGLGLPGPSAQGQSGLLAP